MPAHEYKFLFNVKDKVLLNEIQRPGVIDVLQVDTNGDMYRVSYWDNSDRKTVWVYASEISSRP